MDLDAKSSSRIAARAGRQPALPTDPERMFGRVLDFPKLNDNPGGLLWLAGLLEAERTFLKPPPSMPNRPVVSCRMTDRDVVEWVAEKFGTAVVAIDKGRYRTEYAAIVKGSRAVALMTDLRPLMGRRRRKAIDAAVMAYTPPTRKLDFAQAEQIRRRYAAGESVSALSRSYKVARSTIRPVLQTRIYKAPERTPWLEPANDLCEINSPLPWLTLKELAWLAGWLEGEGSFVAPPPSDPRRPRVSGSSRDQDVIAAVARLLGVTPTFDNSERIRSHGWSPMWRVLLRGRKAVSLMKAIEPVMGLRRTSQIRSALAAAIDASSAKTGSPVG